MITRCGRLRPFIAPATSYLLRCAGTRSVTIGIPRHVEEKKTLLVPPVCNHLLHAGQLKMMLCGGPNQRSDFHINEGEELFFMIKGNMVLNVVERGKYRSIPIQQGQMLLLPPCVPHSPQRTADSIGFVFERERLPKEIDCLRWYFPSDGLNEKRSSQQLLPLPVKENILYEEFFHCTDLGTQLKPIIERFNCLELNPRQIQSQTVQPTDTIAIDETVRVVSARDVSELMTEAARLFAESGSMSGIDLLRLKADTSSDGKAHEFSCEAFLGTCKGHAARSAPECIVWCITGEAKIDTTKSVNVNVKAGDIVRIELPVESPANVISSNPDTALIVVSNSIH
jgi:3-hydroxyanthranilate 3,4-dioxygenase